MTYGSICSGIAADHLSFEGMDCQWFSEIEKFPCAVLKHHYPDIPNHGDITDGIKKYDAVDLVVGGTPCQGFSVAGKRKGLDDDRSNLALRFLEIVTHTRPQWVVWENVPGVFSTDGGRDAGMGGPTEPLTLSTSEYHSEGGASLLSDILETGDLPQRYYLSATACKGILRRAKKRGKTLPPQLEKALRQQATAVTAVEQGASEPTEET
jgi:site-specific DNA-cytosine methylase